MKNLELWRQLFTVAEAPFLRAADDKWADFERIFNALPASSNQYDALSSFGHLLAGHYLGMFIDHNETFVVESQARQIVAKHVPDALSKPKEFVWDSSEGEVEHGLFAFDQWLRANSEFQLLLIDTKADYYLAIIHPAISAETFIEAAAALGLTAASPVEPVQLDHGVSESGWEWRPTFGLDIKDWLIERHGFEAINPNEVIRYCSDGQHAIGVEFSPRDQFVKKKHSHSQRVSMTFWIARRDINELYSQLMPDLEKDQWSATIIESTQSKFFKPPELDPEVVEQIRQMPFGTEEKTKFRGMYRRSWYFIRFDEKLQIFALEEISRSVTQLEEKANLAFVTEYLAGESKPSLKKAANDCLDGRSDEVAKAVSEYRSYENERCNIIADNIELWAQQNPLGVDRPAS